jgi:hypothetical protein
MDECNHRIRKLVKRTYINESVHYVRQCLTCGHVTNAIPHEVALQELDGRIAPIYDSKLRDEWCQSRRQLFIKD